MIAAGWALATGREQGRPPSNRQMGGVFDETTRWQ